MNKQDELINSNNSEDLKFNRLAEGIYYLAHSHETDRPALGIIAGKDKVLAVDAGNSPRHAKLLLKKLSENHIKKPDYVVITHWHWDHFFGSAVFNTTTFAHQITKKKIDEMRHYDWSGEAMEERVRNGQEIEFCNEMIKKENPDRENLQLKAVEVSFEEKLEIDLGDLTCVIERIGGDHSEDSSIVYVPESKMLFMGDCLYPDLYSGNDSYSVDKVLRLIKKIKSYNAHIYVSSHSDPQSKDEMLQLLSFYELVANLILQYGSDRISIVNTCVKMLQRDLSDLEQHVIQLFLEGISKH